MSLPLKNNVVCTLAASKMQHTQEGSVSVCLSHPVCSSLCSTRLLPATGEDEGELGWVLTMPTASIPSLPTPRGKDRIVENQISPLSLFLFPMEWIGKMKSHIYMYIFLRPFLFVFDHKVSTLRIVGLVFLLRTQFWACSLWQRKAGA